MNKRILFIDDNNDTGKAFNSFKREIKTKNNIDVDILFVNPDQPQFENDSSDIDIEKFCKYLFDNFLVDKIDIIACDFNLNEEDKTIAFKLIEFIRKHNKSSSIFIYSGGITKSTLEILKSDGNTGERLLRVILSSNIAAIVNGRGEPIKETILTLLDKPSYNLILESILIDYSELDFSHGYQSLSNKSVDHIIQEIRKGSKEGNQFVREVLEKGIHHAIDLNK